MCIKLRYDNYTVPTPVSQNIRTTDRWTNVSLQWSVLLKNLWVEVFLWMFFDTLLQKSALMAVSLFLYLKKVSAPPDKTNKP